MGLPSTQTLLFRGAIALYVLCISALVASYFAVSTMDIDVSLYLQAPAAIPADAPTAARGIVMNAPTGGLFIGARTDFVVDGKSIGQGETERHGHLHVQLRPPAELAGDRQLHIAIEHPQVEEFELDVPIEIADAPPQFGWPDATSRQSDEKRAHPKPWEGDLEVKVVPSDGEVPRGLPSVVYLLLVDGETGAPVEGEIVFEKLEGMLDSEPPVTVETDALGLAKIPLTAVTSQRWSLAASAPPAPGGDPAEAEERTGTGEVRVYTVPSQFSLVPNQLIAVPGEPVEGLVQTLHRSGGVLVDLYDGARWAKADAFGIGPQGAGVRTTVPDDVRSPLVRLQVYQDFFEPASAWDSRWLAVGTSASSEACLPALRKVLDLHLVHNPELAGWAKAVKESGAFEGRLAEGNCRAWLEATLLAVPHNFAAPPLLVNTQKGDREELDVWRKQMQSKLIIATAGVLFVGFAFNLLLVLRGMKRAQQHARVLREVELETATPEELEVPRPFDVDKWLVVLQTVIIVATLFTFGASLLMLLSWM